MIGSALLALSYMTTTFVAEYQYLFVTSALSGMYATIFLKYSL